MTIYALSSANGKAAIAIFRVSGQNCLKIVKNLTKIKDINPNSILNKTETNNDTTKSFYDLVKIEIEGKDKQCRINIFKAKKKTFSSFFSIMLLLYDKEYIVCGISKI